MSPPGEPLSPEERPLDPICASKAVRSWVRGWSWASGHTHTLKKPPWHPGPGGEGVLWAWSAPPILTSSQGVLGAQQLYSSLSSSVEGGSQDACVDLSPTLRVLEMLPPLIKTNPSPGLFGRGEHCCIL